jgi:hypothetical protein
LSAGVSAFAGHVLPELGLQRNVVVRAAIGGLASVAGGGKFGNGAVTAAFGYLFNDLAHCVKQSAAACLLGGTLLGSAALAGGPGTAAVGAAAGCVGSGLTVLSVCALSESSVGSRAGTAGDQYVVRAGIARPQDLEKGTNFTINGYGFSVQTSPGVSVDQLARGGRFPNNQISWTTVDTLEKIPGVSVNWPTPGAGDYHGTVNLPNPPPPGIFGLISSQFNRIPNPHPVPRN